MSALVHPREPKLTTLRKTLFCKRLPLESEISLYILVSALDVFMTCIVMSHQAADGGHFYESNPVANYFFLKWGMPGMVFFKFAIVSIVVSIIQLIASQQLVTARRICSFAIVISCVVVLYSLSLLVQHAGFMN